MCWPADSSVRRATSTAATHAGCTRIPSIGESVSTPIRSPVGRSLFIAAAKDVRGVDGDHHAPGS